MMCLGKLYKKVTTGSVISCNVLRRELEIITPDLIVVVNPEMRITTSKSNNFFFLNGVQLKNHSSGVCCQTCLLTSFTVFV